MAQVYGHALQLHCSHRPGHSATVPLLERHRKTKSALRYPQEEAERHPWRCRRSLALGKAQLQSCTLKSVRVPEKAEGTLSALRNPLWLPGNRQKGIAVVKPSLPLGSTCMFGAQHSLLPPELNEPFMRHMLTKVHHRNTCRQFSAKIHENNLWFLFSREITRSFASHY